MTTPKWVHNKIQPIAIRDVLTTWSRRPPPRCRSRGRGTSVDTTSWSNGDHDADSTPRSPDWDGGTCWCCGVLTPRIAALWVGLVTPIPSGLARPLVESLHCDAVMNNHDIDTIIPPPAGGLTRIAGRCRWRWPAFARGEVETTWNTGTAAQLPSDPEWAGEIIVYTTPARGITAASRSGCGRTSRAARGSVDGRGAASPERCCGCGPPTPPLAIGGWRCGVTPEGDGSRYEQRAIFYRGACWDGCTGTRARRCRRCDLMHRVRRVTTAAGLRSALGVLGRHVGDGC